MLITLLTGVRNARTEKKAVLCFSIAQATLLLKDIIKQKTSTVLGGPIYMHFKIVCMQFREVILLFQESTELYLTYNVTIMPSTEPKN